MSSRFSLVVSCFFAVIIPFSTVLAERKLITDFYKDTGEFFDLKPREKGTLSFYVPVIESALFPGGGHIGNGHISKAGMGVLVTGLSLALGLSKVLDEGSREREANGAMLGGNVHDIIDKRSFDASRVYFANQNEYWQFLSVAAIHMIDAFFEAIILWERGEPDETTWFVGAKVGGSSYSSSANVDHDVLNSLKSAGLTSGTSSSNQAKKMGDRGQPAAMIGVESGRLARKRFFLDLGLSSARLQYEWWFGVPLSKMGMSSGFVTSNLSPALGFRYFNYDLLLSNSTGSAPNNSFNRFNVSSADLWLGVIWKKALRDPTQPPGKVLDSFVGGIGTYLINVGTTWNHPTAFDSGTGVGSQGLTSQRASDGGFLNTIGIRSWGSLQILDWLDVNLEFDWIVATERKAPGSNQASKLTFWLAQANTVARF